MSLKNNIRVKQAEEILIGQREIIFTLTSANKTKPDMGVTNRLKNVIRRIEKM